MPRTNSGGKREGAGAPKGNAIERRRFSFVAEATAHEPRVEIPALLQAGDLDLQKQMAVAMTACGSTRRQVCAALDMHPTQLDHWMQTEWWREGIKERLRVVAATAQDAYRPLLPLALSADRKVLSDYLDTGKSVVSAMQAAGRVAEHYFGKPLIQAASVSSQAVTIQFINRSDTIIEHSQPGSPALIEHSQQEALPPDD